MTNRLSAFLEACHDGPGDLSSWSTGTLETLEPLIGAKGGVAITVAHCDRPSFACLGARGWAEFLVEPPAEGPFEDDEETRQLFAHMYRPFRVQSARAHAAGLDGAGERLRSAGMARAFPGFCCDIIGMLADLGNLKLMVLLPQRTAGEMSPRDPKLRRLQRHVGGAAQRRMGPAWSTKAALVLNERGSVVSASGAGRTLFSRASDIATAFARDLRPGAEADASAERLWDELWRGGWSVAHVQEADGRRLLVIRRTVPTERQPLSPRERQVLLRARDGAALKSIAAELGTTIGTVSVQLTRGLTKLGLQDRAQLLALGAG